jgi:hypothetical protein
VTFARTGGSRCKQAQSEIQDRFDDRQTKRPFDSQIEIRDAAYRHR